MRARVFAMFLGGVFACSAVLAANSAERVYIAPPAPTTGGPAAPVSYGVLVGATLYIAGHVGLEEATERVPTDVDQEVHLALDAVKQTLSRAGLSMNDLVSVTVYCTDVSLYDRFNKVYRTYFDDKYPSRAFIGVSQLAHGVHFEVAGVAVVPAKTAR